MTAHKLKEQRMVVLRFAFWLEQKHGAGKKKKKKEEEIELGFNIPYHKSELKKWLFLTRPLHLICLKCYWQALEADEWVCVPFEHVCVAGKRFWWKRHRLERRTESRCVRGVENFLFIINAHWPESQSASLQHALNQWYKIFQHIWQLENIVFTG